MKYCAGDDISRLRLPREPCRQFIEGKKNANASSFKSAFIIVFDFEALQITPDSECSCSSEVVQNTERQNNIDYVEEKNLVEKMLWDEGEEEYAICQDLLYDEEGKRIRRKNVDSIQFGESFWPLPPSDGMLRDMWNESFSLPYSYHDAQDLEEFIIAQEEFNEKRRAFREDIAVEESLLWAEALESYENEKEASRQAAEYISKVQKVCGKRKPLNRLNTFRPPREKKEKVCVHRTKVLKEQPPFAYSLLLMDREGVVREKKTYVSEDEEELTDNFIITVLNLADRYLPSLSPGVPMDPLTPQQEAQAEMAEECYLCKDLLGTDRVRDHDHLTGKFLGVAHDSCNLHRKELYTLTCFAHNFSGYDSHFLVRALNRLPERIKKINAIPLTTQKFKSVTVNGNIRFLDSLAFLGDSLDKLVTTLKKSHSTFPILEQLVSGEKKQLLLRKGIYPYSFATGIEKLERTPHLPHKDEFYSDLAQEPCQQSDYEHAQRVWDEFNCANMMDYTVLYVQSDVFQLADVLNDFRNMIWDNFKLDMCQYLSLPHLSMDVMLKESQVEIEHIRDMDMALHLQQNIRGGLSFVNLRYAERGEKDCLMYLDANALYAYAMTHPLPLRDLAWMSEWELEKFDPMLDIKLDSDVGYILTVDLEYPDHLHARHNGYPLAAESKDIEWEELSPYSRDCLSQIYGKTRHRSKKLTATFLPRNKYTVHGLNLKLYLKQGLVLKKIHSGIRFTQKPFLANFIKTCTFKRQTACTKSLSNMWKCVCNSCFGKFIESQDKRMDCRFARTGDKAKINATSPLYKGVLICGEDLTIAFHRKKHLEMNQSWAIGFTILEISKFVMQSLYYEKVLPALGEGNVSLMMSDTDSFLIHVKNHKEEEALKALASVMDFSNLPKDHKLYNNSRPKHPGYLKTEVPLASIAAVAAIKAKTYALKVDHHHPSADREEGDDKINRAKGVTTKVKDRLAFEVYKSCIDTIRAQEVKQRTIRSVKHRNQLIDSTKIAFSSFDDKRYQMCAIHSVPYGSTFIKWQERAGGVCYFCKFPEQYN